jgi:hypothetical protein
MGDFVNDIVVVRRELREEPHFEFISTQSWE